MGTWPWDLSLGQCTGNGEIWGGDVLGGLWIVFDWVPWGGRGRGRETVRSRSTGSFQVSLHDTRSRTTPFLCYIYWAVGVSLHHESRPSGTVSPIFDDLGRHGRCWSFDKLTTSSTHWRQCGGCTSFHHGLHGTGGMVSWHMWSMLYVIPVICVGGVGN